MKLDDFNSSLNKLEHNKANKNNEGFLTTFLRDLQNVVNTFIKNSSPHVSNRLLENSIYVVRDINDEKLSLVNIQNGNEFDIYATYSKDKTEELHSKGIFNDIYEISKTDLYSLNLGSNITIKDGKCTLYDGEIKIENALAAAKLEDLYFCLEQEKDSQYLVSEISDKKIYLTNTKEGGYFSIPKEGYPSLKVGDLVKNVNGKYTLI